MSSFKNKNSLRTIETQIVQKLKNNEARSKFTVSYKKEPLKRVDVDVEIRFLIVTDLASTQNTATIELNHL